MWKVQTALCSQIGFKLRLISLGVSFILALSLAGCAQLPANQKKYDEKNKAFLPSSHTFTQNCLSPYTVKKGDSLYTIAKRCGVSVQEMVVQNHLIPPYTLYPGQLLVLPAQQGVNPSVPLNARRSLPSTLKAIWQWPVKEKNAINVVKDRQGRSQLIIEPIRPITVHAVQAGEVVYASDQLPLVGKMVMVAHPKRLMSVYAHLDAILVKKGQKIEAGTPIGLWLPHGKPLSPELKGSVEARYRGRKIDILPLLK